MSRDWNRPRSDLFQLPRDTFCALTGFRDAQHAREELEKSNCLETIRQMDRHRVALPAERLQEACNVIKEAMPQLADVATLALERELGKTRKSVGKDSRGRKTSVDDRHVFLLVFVYVFGGMFEWAGPLLPGIRVRQSRFAPAGAGTPDCRPALGPQILWTKAY